MNKSWHVAIELSCSVTELSSLDALLTAASKIGDITQVTSYPAYTALPQDNAPAAVTAPVIETPEHPPVQAEKPKRAKKEAAPAVDTPISGSALTALRAKAAEKIAESAANRPLVHAVIAKFSADADSPRMSAIPASAAQDALDALEAL